MFSWLKKILPVAEKVGHLTEVDVPAEPSPNKPDPLQESGSWKVRGNEFLTQGKLEEAAECYRQAVSINPDFAEGFLNLGFVLKEQKRFAEAEQQIKQAVRINPTLEDAYYILGVISQERGDLAGAIANFTKALDIKPDFEVVYLDLGRVLFRSGQTEGAKRVIEKGLSLNPDSAELHFYLGNIYAEEKALEKALACYQKALLIWPDSPAIYNNLGSAYIDLGRVDEAIESYQKVLSLYPDSIEAASSLLFIQSFAANGSPAKYLEEAKALGSKLVALARPYTDWHVSLTSDGSSPLRVGLVSGDLKGHPVGFFLESLLAHLNQSRVELVAYNTQTHEDALTARIKPRFVAWSCIAGLSDEAAAQKIHADGIHILVDLAGHTSHNRLPLFAWKPAPVQVSWLGYFASTGVPGIDYLLADPISVPESQREQFTETIWYLPDTRLCFTAPATDAQQALKPPPAAQNGFITFGCFQNVRKISDDVLAVWGTILQALPQARLRLQNKQMNSDAAREQLAQRLARVGIGQDRVTLEGPISREAYLAAHAEVDIILDTFPYPGGTTTCEALWMGVPTLTLAGDTMLARQGASMLTCAGLGEWVANDKSDYVAQALSFAKDVDRLAQLRAGLREQVLASPLFDAPRFARHLEDALQGMWQHKMSGASEHV